MESGTLIEMWRTIPGDRASIRAAADDKVKVQFFKQGSNVPFSVSVVSTLEAARVGLVKWDYYKDSNGTRHRRAYEKQKAANKK